MIRIGPRRIHQSVAFATRWTGRPGYDRQLDEWLALYKVISRLMVNTELPDHQLVGGHPEQLGTGCVRQEAIKDNLIEQQGMLLKRQPLVVPWWTGSQLPCSTLDSRELPCRRHTLPLEKNPLRRR